MCKNNRYLRFDKKRNDIHLCLKNENEELKIINKELQTKLEELEIIKLDTYQGNVSIKGRVDSMAYIDSGSKKDKENSIINKLFK